MINTIEHIFNYINFCTLTNFECVELYNFNIISDLKLSDQNSGSEAAPPRKYGPFLPTQIRIRRSRIFLPFKRKLSNFKGNLVRANREENSRFPRKLIVYGGGFILVVIVGYIIFSYMCPAPVVLHKIPGPIFRVRYSEITIPQINSVPTGVRRGFSAFGGSLVEQPWESLYPFDTEVLQQVHILEITAIGDWKRNTSLSRYECADGITCPQFLSRGGMRDRYIERLGNFGTWNDKGAPVLLYGPVYHMCEDESLYVEWPSLGDTTVFGFHFYNAPFQGMSNYDGGPPEPTFNGSPLWYERFMGIPGMGGPYPIQYHNYCDWNNHWDEDGRFMWFASGGGDVTNCYSRTIPNRYYREFQYWFHLWRDHEFDSYGNRMWRVETYVNNRDNQAQTHRVMTTMDSW